MISLPDSYVDAKEITGGQLTSIARKNHEGKLNQGINHDNLGLPYVGEALGITSYPTNAISKRRTKK